MAGSERFDMGRLVRRTVAVLGRNLGLFALASLLLSGLPAVLLDLTKSGLGLTGEAARVADLLGSVVSVATGAFLDGALISATISDLNGRKLTFGQMMSAASSAWLPLVGVSLLYGSGVVLGLILLVVPGLLLLTMWAVTSPVAAVERTGVYAAFHRSAELTRDHRWAIFGLYAATGLAILLLAFTVAVPLTLFQHAGSGPLPPHAHELGSAVVSVALNMLTAVFSACLYHELRTDKEGGAPRAVADVFA